MSGPSLSVRDLRVGIGRREIVHGVSFEVHPEQTWASSASRIRQVDDGARGDRSA